MSIQKLFHRGLVREMARTRGEAVWAVLDWASQQTGDFTINDMYKVFVANGGGSTIQQFHTIIGHLTAKPWKDDQEKYALGPNRPLRIVKRGARGKGGAGTYEWGLDGPLRAPQQPKEPLAPEGSPLGDILDRLEDKLGRDQLKAAMARWKRMTDVHKIAADIRATIPARYQIDAMQVGTEHLVSSGQADEEEVEDAEEADLAPQAQQPSAPPTPFAPPKAKPPRPAPPPSAPKPTKAKKPEPEPEEEPEAGEDLDDVPDDFFHDDEGGGEEPEPETEEEPGEEEAEAAEYPAYLPDANEDGDKAEYAMHRLATEGDLGPDADLWEKLKNSKNDVDASNIVRQSGLPTSLHRSALIVAKAIFDNTGRDWETGKKLGKESRLLRLYRESPLEEPVDFDQKSGLARILKVK